MNDAGEATHQGSWCIEVSIDREPAAVSRLLDQVARQGLIPQRLVAETVDETICVTFDFVALERSKAERIIALFQTLPAVSGVSWRHLQDRERGEIA
jgi:hypothetical protein